MDLITDRYAEKISGIFECYDRTIIQGTLPGNILVMVPLS